MPKHKCEGMSVECKIGVFTMSLFVSNFTRSYCMENANPSEFTIRNIGVRVTVVSVLCCIGAM